MVTADMQDTSVVNCTEYFLAALDRLKEIPSTSPELRKLVLSELHVEFTEARLRLTATDEDVRAMLTDDELTHASWRAVRDLIARVSEESEIDPSNIYGAGFEAFNGGYALDAVTEAQNERRDELEHQHAQLAAWTKPGRWVGLVAPAKSRAKWTNQLEEALSWFELTEGEQQTLDAQTEAELRGFPRAKAHTFDAVLDALLEAAGFELEGAEAFALKKNGDRLRVDPYAIDLDALRHQFDRIAWAFRVLWGNVLADLWATIEVEGEGGAPVEEGDLGSALRRAARAARQKEAEHQRERAKKKAAKEAADRKAAAEERRREHQRRILAITTQVNDMQSASELKKAKRWAKLLLLYRLQRERRERERLLLDAEPGEFTASMIEGEATEAFLQDVEERWQALSSEKPTSEADKQMRGAELRLLGAMKFDPAGKARDLNERMIAHKAEEMNRPIESRDPDLAERAADDDLEFG